MGKRAYEERLIRQARKTAKLLHQGEGFFRLERYFPLDAMVGLALTLAGMGGRARRNFLDVRVVTREWKFPRLPREFDGFRLLQLSDLHLDLELALVPVIERVVAATPHDAAVLTGDYRNKTDGDDSVCLREMAKVIRVLAPRRWGILGNHDFLEMVPHLESAGLPILLNEVAAIERGGQRIWIAGVDDPHFYGGDDVVRVRSAIPIGDFAILLAHSPENFSKAERAGFDLQLSGHTHGGQLCLPGGTPVVLPCKIDRKFVKGAWQSGALNGYTSPGTGGCGVAARLNCPPEVTLHILRCQ